MKIDRIDGSLFTFVPNKKTPVYNWFYYKEGFSRELVIDIIKKEHPKSVLDPFCGSGTTLLAAKEMNVSSYGFDVTPIAVFVSRTKTRNYDRPELEKYYKQIFSQKFVKLPIRKDVKKWFSKYTLEDVEFFKSVIKSIPGKYGDFFKLGLMNAAMKCSYVYKDGNALKVRKKNVPPLRIMFKRIARRMIKEIMNGPEPFVDFGDARNLNVENVDLIITSPPYLNKIEYKNVYRIENKLFFSLSPRPPIRSYFGLREEEKFEVENIIGDYDPNVLAYFDDIYKSLKEMHRVLNEGGKAYIIIGDGVSGSKVIDVLKITRELAEDVGFTAEHLYVGNERTATTPTRRKIGVLREGMLVFKK